jgi:Protein of unknown function (DUF3606)
MPLVQSASDNKPIIAFSMEPIGGAGLSASDGESLVDVTSDGSLAYWMEAFAASEEQLRRAVAAVGSDARAVKDYLGAK